MWEILANEDPSWVGQTSANTNLPHASYTSAPKNLRSSPDDNHLAGELTEILRASLCHGEAGESLRLDTPPAAELLVCTAAAVPVAQPGAMVGPGKSNCWYSFMVNLDELWVKSLRSCSIAK